jgi:hypothetical protein
MTGPRINQDAGTFDIHPMEADAFCEYLRIQGVPCEKLISQPVAHWNEVPGARVPQPDRVHIGVAPPDRLHEITKLYASWRLSAAEEAGSASPLG